MRLGTGVALLLTLATRAWAGDEEAELRVGEKCGFVVGQGAVVTVQGDVRATGELTVAGRLEVHGDLRAPAAAFAASSEVHFVGEIVRRVEVPASSLTAVRTDGLVISGNRVVASAPRTGSMRASGAVPDERSAGTVTPLATVPPESGSTRIPDHFARPVSRGIHRPFSFRSGSSRGPPAA